MPHFDLVVVGGGINGCGIARDAAGRGLSVLLCEQHDLAAHTSSASSKLIHGGLRYLEQREFGLVRKALAEREVLLRAAPHLVWPLRFVLPYTAGMRPAWLIRFGLWLYDHLSSRARLGESRAVCLAHHPAGMALQPQFARGFEYADAWGDDARLVVANAMDARSRGATVATRTRLVGATRGVDAWTVELEAAQARCSVRARALVNAAGPWADRLLSGVLGQPSGHRLRLVRGSHIVLPRLFEHDYAYVLQQPDRRIVFVLPYERDFTLVGTTDVEQGDEDPGAVAISPAETEYLCAALSRYLRRAVAPSDVVASYAGVRPLLEDEAGAAAEVSRDYLLELDAAGAPLLSVFGGKLTTYRRLAEEAVDRLGPRLGCRAKGWTATASLPGGELPGSDFAAWRARIGPGLLWLPEALFARWSRNYGSRLFCLLGSAQALADLGEEVLPGLYRIEIDYLLREEFARSAEDILWRRTRLGLHLPTDATARLQAWLDARAPAAPQPSACAAVSSLRTVTSTAMPR